MNNIFKCAFKVRFEYNDLLNQQTLFTIYLTRIYLVNRATSSVLGVVVYLKLDFIDRGVKLVF